MFTCCGNCKLSRTCNRRCHMFEIEFKRRYEESKARFFKSYKDAAYYLPPKDIKAILERNALLEKTIEYMNNKNI